MTGTEILAWVKVAIAIATFFKKELTDFIKSKKDFSLNSKGGTTAKCADRTQATNERRNQ